ncbi:Lar family restriction alleviation protein [Acetobacteraceae bacterium ESL0709]|nr:Lar family restriction alleviation protein [Acetobacteraceae bacterium ESL0697]MDF7677418.1 Lar family restriction alleviation protein [Acetobacteraceae bacterium ESL0709]
MKGIQTVRPYQKKTSFEPCPFCKGRRLALHYGVIEWWVICQEETCQANGPRARGKEIARGLWNNRAGEREDGS